MAMTISQYHVSGAFVYRSTLHSRYLLDDKWIARLGPRDRQVPNPYHPSCPPTSMYRVARVEAFLESHARQYADYIVSRAKHTLPLNADDEKREQETFDWAWVVKIEHRTWPDDLWQTCRTHLQSVYRSGLLIPVPEVTARRIQSMLRHEYSNYEYLLAQTDGKTGAPDACAVLKRRANSEIAKRLYACGVSVSDIADRIAV